MDVYNTINRTPEKMAKMVSFTTIKNWREQRFKVLSASIRLGTLTFWPLLLDADEESPTPFHFQKKRYSPALYLAWHKAK